jgi:hypothetical protein
MRGIQLRARAGLRSGRGRWLVPPWIAPAFILCALILIVWAAFLILTLPGNYTANHWHVAWGGFDIGLGVALVATAVAVVRRSPYAEVAAAVSGTLLVCDAWFDVLTAHGGDRVWSLLSALVVELPLAAAMIAGSLQVFRLVAARLWVLEPGAHSWQVPIPLPSEADAAVRRRPRGPGERRTVAS